MYLCICLIVLSFTFVLATDRGDACLTPYGEKATCISVLSCPGLLHILLTKNRSAIKYAVQFQCGYDTEPLVCCRFSDYPPDVFDIFTMRPPQTGTSLLDPGIEDNFPEGLLPEEECGREIETNRILPGGAVNVKEFPWLAALQYKDKSSGENAGIRCGGSIINKCFVLTAAQCIVDREYSVTDVWLGDWTLSTKPYSDGFVPKYDHADKIQKIKVAEAVPHPFYSRRTGNNDIGLLKLEKDIDYTNYIQPVCLPPPRIPIPTTRTPFVTAGWETRMRGTSDTKVKKTVQLLSNFICEQVYQYRPIGPNQICATGKLEKVSYLGDPGGILMRTYTNTGDRQTRWYQEGVGAWDEGVKEPFVYTRVSRYIRWIANIITRDLENNRSYQVSKV